MRKLAIIAGFAACILAAQPAAAASERTMTGVAIGAGAGAVVAGPPGAVIGGVVGAVVGGPRISRAGRVCWRDRRGVRHCRWR